MKISNFVKELFIAYYDTDKNIIVNASPNTLIYFHEEGHVRQVKNGKYQLIMICFGFLILLILGILVRENFYAKFIYLIAVGLYMYLEVDAWVYAIKKVSRN